MIFAGGIANAIQRGKSKVKGQNAKGKMQNAKVKGQRMECLLIK